MFPSDKVMLLANHRTLTFLKIVNVQNNLKKKRKKKKMKKYDSKLGDKRKWIYLY